MTALLQRAVAEAEKLPQEDQDAIATRLLAEIEDERKWTASFDATTDAQWDQMIKEAQEDVAAGRVHPLEVAFLPMKQHREFADHEWVSGAPAPAS